MLKRFADFTVSLIGLIILFPIIIIVAITIFLSDGKSPFYIANRVGKDERLFLMVKLRSMKENADSTGVSSTASDDKRITFIGQYVRRFKIDELMQLWNVLKGDMSLVGPRPNVRNEVETYTALEKKLLSIRPGITDFASIVFADESDILFNKKNPDLSYNQLIRPTKSRLGLHYISCQSMTIDIIIIFLTIFSFISRKSTLKIISKILEYTNSDKDLQTIVLRESPLMPMLPPDLTDR
tara:strand:+ start:3108 stop:3824 length:717 start_codon:yes stop_codon:yes gene_type:complete